MMTTGRTVHAFLLTSILWVTPAIATSGEAALAIRSEKIATAIRAAKSDETSLRLQNEFQEAARRPIETKQ